MGLHSMRAMESEARSESGIELPFEDSIDLELFYDGAGRGEVLAKLLEAVAAAAPLMVLSGGEGSGKTAMCRMLEWRCRDALRVVFFAATVESFEDVVRNIATALSLQLGQAEEGRGMDGAVDQIVARLAEDGSGLLLIFDQAEDIYLATLERIRKMLDRVTAAGVRLQILFSGRKTFLENCEQLAICDFRTSDGIHFDLPPLDELQTADYLRSIAAKTLPAEKCRVFNDEVVRSIHGLAKGRPRRINRLAQESLRSHGNDISFMTLLDTVQEDLAGEREDAPPRRRLAGKISWSWVAGSVVLLLAVLLIFRPAEEAKLHHKATAGQSLSTVVEERKADQGRKGEERPADTSLKETHPQSPVPPPPPTELGVGREVKPSSGPEEAVVASQVKVETAAVPEDQRAAEEVRKPQAAGPGSSERAEAVADAATTKAAAVPEAAAPETSANPAVVETVAESKESKRKDVVSTPSEVKLPVLRQHPPKKVRPASWSEKDAEAAKLQAKGEGAEPTATLTVDQLYQKRLQAGSVWLASDKNDKFTVQLMVLTAKNAEANIKKLLGQPPYRQEAGNFFIFRKSGSPEVVWVFYGEYPSMDLARVAQNSLPPFLREHQPYAIAVKGAIAKVQGK